MVQRVASGASELTVLLARVAHPSIARPLSFHQYRGQGYIAYEFVDMDLFDVLPLYHAEVAAVMWQVINAVHHLLAHAFAFRIDTIHVSLTDVARLVRASPHSVSMMQHLG